MRRSGVPKSADHDGCSIVQVGDGVLQRAYDLVDHFSISSRPGVFDPKNADACPAMAGRLA
jgi:hypothetical protein